MNADDETKFNRAEETPGGKPAKIKHDRLASIGTESGTTLAFRFCTRVVDCDQPSPLATNITAMPLLPKGSGKTHGDLEWGMVYFVGQLAYGHYSGVLLRASIFHVY